MPLSVQQKLFFDDSGNAKPAFSLALILETEVFPVFNFKDELSRYQPILELNDIENALHPSQMQDLLDILQHIAKSTTQPPSEE